MTMTTRGTQGDAARHDAKQHGRRTWGELQASLSLLGRQ